MTILDSADYPAVRAAILTDLPANELTDDIIALDIYQGAAERELINIDATAESRTGSELLIVRAAAVLLTAARLCPAVARKISIKIQAGSQSYDKAIFDPTKRAAELREAAFEQLNLLLEPSDTAIAKPTFFALATGRRGR